MKVTIIVELKQEVLDPQGKAIQHSLETLGFPFVEDVRAGKVFRVTLNEKDLSHADVTEQIRQMCDRLLANPVMERYSFTIED